MKIADLFPECSLIECNEPYGHSHVLEHQREIVTDTHKYLYCQGGVGSAKTVAFAAKHVLLSLMIPRNVGIVFRKDLKINYKTAWQAVKECIQRLVDKGIIEEPEYISKSQGDYTKIQFRKGDGHSILLAGQTKNISEYLGPSYGHWWADDAYENGRIIFVGDETSGGLMSRLRLPYVANYKTADGRHVNMLRGSFSSNPPPGHHWLHEFFGKTAGVRKIGDTLYRHMQVNTRLNTFLTKDYIREIMATHTVDEAQRLLNGESIISFGGLPVYPQFVEGRHVGQFEFNPAQPLIRSWDFGFHHPSVVYSNLFVCGYGFNHYLTLDTTDDVFSSDVWSLYKVVVDYTKEQFKDIQDYNILDCGDRAGFRRSDTNKDKRGPIMILQDEYGMSFRYRYFDLENSLDYMRGLLKKKCRCGLEMIQIHRRCENLIDGLKGGYKYPKNTEGVVGDKPIKDKFYDDILDAWRYGGENYVRFGLDESPPPPESHEDDEVRYDHAWEWMERRPLAPPHVV